MQLIDLILQFLYQLLFRLELNLQLPNLMVLLDLFLAVLQSLLKSWRAGRLSLLVDCLLGFNFKLESFLDGDVVVLQFHELLSPAVILLLKGFEFFAFIEQLSGSLLNLLFGFSQFSFEVVGLFFTTFYFGDFLAELFFSLLSAFVSNINFAFVESLNFLFLRTRHREDLHLFFIHADLLFEMVVVLLKGRFLFL